MSLFSVAARFGQRLRLVPPEGEPGGYFSAFLRPLRYKNKMYLDGVNTEIGFNAQGHYLYIGPPSVDLTAAAEGTLLQAGVTLYKIDRCEKVFFKNEPLYIWAIVRTVVE